MAVIALVGGTGAPGVTTSALGLLLTWPVAADRRVVLVEASPDGGRVAGGYLEGRFGARWSLSNLADSIWQGTLNDAFVHQLLDVDAADPHRRFVLPGLRGPSQAAAMDPVWDQLATLCSSLELSSTDVLVDLGRRGAFGPSAVLALNADVVLMVVRRRLAGLDDAAARLEVLMPALADAGGADAARLLVVGDGPYSGGDIARQLRVPLLAEVPFSPKHAEPLSDGPADKVVPNSPLMRAYRSAASALLGVVAERRSRLQYPGPGVGGWSGR